MAVRDEAVALLRGELGAGFEAATFAALCKEYTLRHIASRLKANRVAKLDMTALVNARTAAEDALRTETEARLAAVATAEAEVDAELGTI